MFGEDEDPELCYKTVDRVQEKEKTLDDDKNRLDTFDISEFADINHDMTQNINFKLIVIIGISLSTALTFFAFCFAIVIVTFKKLKTKRKLGQDEITPALDRQISNESSNEYMPTPQVQTNVQKPQWTFKTTSIVKELGKGFYSKVYLAQDTKSNFVALKTVDSKKTSNAEECITNEINILSNIDGHLNIVELLGFNADEKLLVMEYCFNGNLKDYISRYREYYMDEIDPSTKELFEEIESPDSSADVHILDRTKEASKDAESKEDEEFTISQMVAEAKNKCLIKTRRLLYWSYQIAEGMKFLSDNGIIHRDIALRNMLLTNSDIVKIADFGLAVSLFPNNSEPQSESLPQYWSRSNKPQPYKWMALESLVSNVYSQASDVWSFGITVWELFTLGGEPYGEINPTSLANLLNLGSRLEECSLAPKSLNLILQQCWHYNPAQRPQFEDISLNLSRVMSTAVMEKYEALLDSRSTMSKGEGYVSMNANTMRISTPSTGTASKSSTRSRTVSKCSESSYLTSSYSSQVPSPKNPRASYWANYKMMTGLEPQVFSSIDKRIDQEQSIYAVPQFLSITQRTEEPIYISRAPNLA